jgi:PAP2 superfamily
MRPDKLKLLLRLHVPTMVPFAITAALRKPWVLDKCDQFRPGPPPELTSDVWAQDYNEIKAIGAKNNSKRTPEQTEIAKFWEATNPIIYLPVAHSAANRDLAYNARYLAVVSMTVDDALGAIFDAKYTYNFWRPVTAIRNGDIDGNDATERDASWLPLIDTPVHPEYPCAHCIVSGTIGTLVKAASAGKNVQLSTGSPTLPGKIRTWSNTDEFMQEVATARILDGVHYRNSTEVGTAMGKKIGEFAAAKYFQ